MVLLCRWTVGLAAVFAVIGVVDVAAGQSALERSPNLSGGWLGAPGTLQFNFVHRFGVTDPPQRKVTSSPTFLLSYRLPFPLTVGVNYATASQVARNYPNEWEAFARYAQSGIALQGDYNQAAASADAELSAAHTTGPLRLMLAGRAFSNGYHSDTARLALGGGAALRLSRWIALAGDVTTLLDRRANEDVAWGAALQVAIPYSPHTISLQVTNTNTTTLQGSSVGKNIRGGFEFTIPFTLSRYFGGAGRRDAAAPAGDAIPADIRSNAFAPNRIEVASGRAVRWTNNDQVVHTVTADDGSWDSGPIEPGASWTHMFEKAGDYSFHCTPHPFMKGVVVVR